MEQVFYTLKNCIIGGTRYRITMDQSELHICNRYSLSEHHSTLSVMLLKDALDVMLRT